jgi:hypothetical protein
MSWLSNILGNGYDDIPSSYEQPQAAYPVETEQEDTSKLCRACSGGLGDGICSYHAHQFRIQIRKQEKRARITR